MPTMLKEHIRERPPHLPRRRERDRVIAIGKHPPLSTNRLIEPARDPNRQTARAIRKQTLVVSLDHQMKVIRLNRILDEAKSSALFPVTKRPAYGGDAALRSKARHLGNAHRQVKRNRRFDRRPTSMHLAGMGPIGFAARTHSSTTPGAELEGLLPRHLD
jgi:hypothetical protein